MCVDSMPIPKIPKQTEQTETDRNGHKKKKQAKTDRKRQDWTETKRN